MRAVIQRAARASVTIEGRVAGAIDRGLLVLVAVAEGDTPAAQRNHHRPGEGHGNTADESPIN